MNISTDRNVAHAGFKWLSFRRIAFAVSLAILSITAQAGKITAVPSASGTDGFGGVNLDNIEVHLNGEPISTFDESNGAYVFSDDSDHTYSAYVFDDDVSTTLMGYVFAKDWPIGEPAGIKIVNDDFDVKKGRPANCIISTSYLVDHFVSSKDPQQVTCSGPFQSHKRYKLAMLPSSVDGAGSESIDLVFNVEQEAGSRDYQVFQKINNWTDGRLEGFTVQVGFGTGGSFQSIADAGVNVADLSLSVPGNVFDLDQMANFSTGLFGPVDTIHGRPAGFFDPDTRAGFVYNEYPNLSGQTDKLTTKGTLGSDYADVPAGALAAGNQFGPWLSNRTLPHGVFFDDDGNPSTDAVLIAWYGFNPDPAVNALGWMRGVADNFAAVSDAEVVAMGENLSYTSDFIDDLVNVGLNYVITVGDVSTFPGSTFTIRVTPAKDTSGVGDPVFTGVMPTPKVVFTNTDASIILEPNPEFKIGDLLTARVGDDDLNVDPAVAEEVDVLITASAGLPDLTLTLVELGEDRGVFAATLPEEYSLVDKKVTVTVSYVDAVNSTGIPVTRISSTTAEPSGKLQFKSGAYTVPETADSVVVTVDRIEGTIGEVTMEYSTVSGTAIGGEDYISDTGTLTFADGVDSQTITILLIDDTEPESDQTFTVLLSNVAGNAALGDIASTEVTIAANDAVAADDDSGLFGLSWMTAGLFLLALFARGKRKTA